MTHKEIQKQLDYIERIKEDFEIAHMAQENLLIDFINYVSKCSEPKLARKAKRVLRVLRIKFARHFA